MGSADSQGQARTVHGVVELDLPELGRLALPLAGLGSRGVAAIVDFVLFNVVLVLLALLAFVVIPFNQMVALGLLTAVLSLSTVVVPMLFELWWGGQTPGKRMFGLRVLTVEGTRPTALQIMVRNVMRLVDFLPAFYTVGVVAMFASAYEQRLGDLVSGTIVVREDTEALGDIADRPVDVTASVETHGIPEPLLRAAHLLSERRADLDPTILSIRRAEVLAGVRQHRPDLAACSDQEIWDRLLGTPRSSDG